MYSAKQSIKELSKIIVSSELIPVDYAYNIALNTIREVGAENGEVFWKNAKLTIPTEVSYPDGNTACYLFQIVYNNKIVGEIATSATIQECPVMFFTYNNNMSSTIKNKGEVYFVPNNGFVKLIGDKYKYIGKSETIDKKALDTITSKKASDLNRSDIKAQWQDINLA